MYEGDRPIISDCYSVYCLWEQRHECIIGIVQMSCVKAPECVERRHDIMPDHQPCDLEEAGCEAIGARCLIWWQSLDYH
jgi:hypothetical protein